MKKIILTTVLVGLGLSAVFATPPKDGQFIEKRIAHMTEKLDLNDNQAASVQSILEAQHIKMTEIHEETQRMLKNVLTDEQFAKLEKMREKSKHKIKKKLAERE